LIAKEGRSGRWEEAREALILRGQQYKREPPMHHTCSSRGSKSLMPTDRSRHLLFFGRWFWVCLEFSTFVYLFQKALDSKQKSGYWYWIAGFLHMTCFRCTSMIQLVFWYSESRFERVPNSPLPQHFMEAISADSILTLAWRILQYGPAAKHFGSETQEEGETHLLAAIHLLLFTFKISFTLFIALISSKSVKKTPVSCRRNIWFIHRY